ncbi:MAG: type VI secretion protein [Altererythrobacter sp. XM-24bin4]|jgi:type IV secretion system protein VirB6|uniref:type IV secretion system protein n=1 Tax=uncultured Altererythrobacter sp. TaxID=500840 RepID=UPI000D7B2F59|nr:type IV secretion system protein [uncultured Altererythrobacter sp.]PWL25559.1 MAG: type VI secretion protein [Altererythrobacter sp. XM-24bin4]
MAGTCDTALEGMGGGIASALQAIECMAQQGAAGMFGSLFAPGGALQTTLVILLTFYVAFFGISLMLGRSSLSVRALVPRMMTLGLVLTFATSWVAYQGVVWNLIVWGPEWLARVLTGSDGPATLVFGQKLDVVFEAVQQASQGQENFEAFSPPGLMWLGAVLLLLGTVGILATSKIALALLVAIGPAFVVMALFNGTRGLFTGWLKGLVMLALVPLFAVLGGTIMLELAVPVLSALVAIPGEVSPRAAMAFFLIGAVHVALMFMVLKVTGTMVAGWQVFGLAPQGDTVDAAAVSTFNQTSARVAEARNATIAATASGARRVDVAAATMTNMASDGGGTGSTARVRETRVYATSGGSAAPHSDTRQSTSRTRGIGNRFRPVQARALARKSETSS